MFFEVFENVTCLVFEALDGPIGLILASSWADLVPKWAPKLLQQLSKKCPKNDPKINFTWPHSAVGNKYNKNYVIQQIIIYNY